MSLRFLFFLLVFAVLASCGKRDKPQAADEETSVEASHDSHANEHMHESSIEELIARFEDPERDLYQKPEDVISLLGDLEGKTVMDLGAGSGYFTFRLAEKGAKVIAADVEDGFLDHLRQRAADEGQGLDVEVRKIPYDDPQLDSSEADIVLVVNTYHHIDDRTDYFAKVRTGLKQDGTLMIVDYFKRELPVGPPVDHKLDEQTVIDELKMAGFTNFLKNTWTLEYQYIIQARLD